MTEIQRLTLEVELARGEMNAARATVLAFDATTEAIVYGALGRPRLALRAVGYAAIQTVCAIGIHGTTRIGRAILNATEKRR